MSRSIFIEFRQPVCSVQSSNISLKRRHASHSFDGALSCALKPFNRLISFENTGGTGWQTYCL